MTLSIGVTVTRVSRQIKLTRRHRMDNAEYHALCEYDLWSNTYCTPQWQTHVTYRNKLQAHNRN